MYEQIRGARFSTSYKYVWNVIPYMEQQTGSDEAPSEKEIAVLQCTSCGDERDPSKDSWFGSDIRVCGKCYSMHVNGNNDFDIGYNYPHTIYKDGSTAGKVE